MDGNWPPPISNIITFFLPTTSRPYAIAAAVDSTMRWTWKGRRSRDMRWQRIIEMWNKKIEIEWRREVRRGKERWCEKCDKIERHWQQQGMESKREKEAMTKTAPISNNFTSSPQWIPQCGLPSLWQPSSSQSNWLERLLRPSWAPRPTHLHCPLHPSYFHGKFFCSLLLSYLRIYLLQQYVEKKKKWGHSERIGTKETNDR